MENCTILVKAVDAHSEDNEEGMGTTCKDIIEEEDEVFLSVVPDTVIDPWAMMIHFCDTGSAS